jgi:hypothetical protein
MKPDIVVIFTHQTVLFEPQNQRVAEWLRRRCNLVMENAKGNTEIRGHPSRRKEIVEELKAAGFAVSD